MVLCVETSRLTEAARQLDRIGSEVRGRTPAGGLSTVGHSLAGSHVAESTARVADALLRSVTGIAGGCRDSARAVSTAATLFQDQDQRSRSGIVAACTPEPSR